MVPDMDKVAEAIREVAAEEILPRFRNLADEEVRVKHHAQDLVTTADVEAEKRLSDALRALVPGSVVVGEEACEEDPGLLGALADPEPCWVVDPVDGTLNFAEGRDRFCVIVAFCQGGETRAGWVFDPVRNVLAQVMAGEGAWIGERRLRTAAPVPVSDMAGSLGRTLGRRVTEMRMRGEDAPARIERQRCTGLDWVDLATGRLHFAHYAHRLKPWDHAAGVLMHAEVGGHAALLPEGKGYRPDRGILRESILAAPDAAGWEALKEVLGL